MKNIAAWALIGASFTAFAPLAAAQERDETYYAREFNDFAVMPGEPQQVSLRVSRQF